MKVILFGVSDIARDFCRQLGNDINDIIILALADNNWANFGMEQGGGGKRSCCN